MSDDELIGQTADFKQRHENGESLDSLLPESFATVREASRPGAGQAALRRPDDGRCRAAPGQHRRDEDR